MEKADQVTVRDLKQVYRRQRKALQRVEQLQFAEAVAASHEDRLVEALVLSSLYLETSAPVVEQRDMDLCLRWGRLVKASKEKRSA